MLLNEHTTHVESKLFSEIPDITHGFSCKGAGDMRDIQTLLKFQRSLGISESFFQPRQVHGSTVVVNPKHTATVNAVGILLFRGFSQVESVGVLAADCVRFFTDSHGTCIGAVHSG
jgi:copper oxidase (laccase) domain-containing protein